MVSSAQREITYSVEHFYPKHPGHPLAPLTAEYHGYFKKHGIDHSHLHIAGDNDGSIDLLIDGKTDFSMDAHPAMLIEANAHGKAVGYADGGTTTWKVEVPVAVDTL